ncbi:hypothetical protein AMTR_s00086p00127240 [Amborella trichopoda]|uniref:Uncharacterized protein n=1 Tax=Amborella trichopoda TaxID=13333 RepID=W1P587_AMBTC|nr:hypothetical protein AMTR_s00086p00127240 [Amborella trichopoda]
MHGRKRGTREERGNIRSTCGARGRGTRREKGGRGSQFEARKRLLGGGRGKWGRAQVNCRRERETDEEEGGLGREASKPVEQRRAGSLPSQRGGVEARTGSVLDERVHVRGYSLSGTDTSSDEGTLEAWRVGLVRAGSLPDCIRDRHRGCQEAHEMWILTAYSSGALQPHNQGRERNTMLERKRVKGRE